MARAMAMGRETRCARPPLPPRLTCSSPPPCAAPPSSPWRAPACDRRRLRGRGGRLLLLGLQARLQRLHEIDDLALRRLRRRHRDLLAGDLLLDHRLRRLAVLVLVLGRIEGVGGELVDELHGEIDLGRLERHLVAPLDVAEVSHLVGVVERVHHQSVLRLAHQDELLAAARREAGDGALAGALHRLAEKAVRLVAALVRTEQVGPVEVDGIDLGDGNELLDLDRLVALTLQRLELVRRQDRVLALGVLVPLDHVAALHHLPAAGAHVLLPQARLVLLVQQVER